MRTQEKGSSRGEEAKRIGSQCEGELLRREWQVCNGVVLRGRMAGGREDRRSCMGVCNRGLLPLLHIKRILYL